MVGGGASHTSEGDSVGAQPVKRGRASSSTSAAPVDLEEAWSRAERKRKNGVKDYWKHVRTEKQGNKVVYVCLFCERPLSAANPHDSVARHITFTSSGPSCKYAEKLDNSLLAARKGAIGMYFCALCKQLFLHAYKY